MGKPRVAAKRKRRRAAKPPPVITSTNFAVLVKRSGKARFCLEASNLDEDSEPISQTDDWDVELRKLDEDSGIMLCRATFLGRFPFRDSEVENIIVTVTNTDAGTTQESEEVKIPVITDDT